MRQLLNKLNALKASDIKRSVESKLAEFKALGAENDAELFKELCFCILTANYTAEGGIRVQNKVGDGFLHLSEAELAGRLKTCGHRFPNTRASYIAESRKHCKGLKNKLKSFENEQELRQWLAGNVKGLGYKEASHFLRNIGYEGLAIIDFHIIDLLARHKLIREPKTLTKKNYLEIEKKLAELAKKTGMTLAELDLYLWYMETGKILK